MTETTIWFIIFRIVTDVIALVIVWIPLPIFEYLVSPFMRGYYCNDESIMYPYYPDTISPGVLFGVTFGVNFICIMIIEAIHAVFGTRSWFRYRGEPNVPSQMRIICCNDKPLFVPFAIQRIYKCFLHFVLGYGITMFLTEVGKFSIGRLRPHFLSVCQPNASACAGAVGSQAFSAGLLPYVIEPQCGTPEILAARLKDARLSFPSGHSSLSFFAAVFFVLYLQARLPIHRLRALRLALQTVAIAGAFYCGLSRVSDNKHHPTDVLAGAILGVLVALFTVCFSFHIVVFYGLRLFGPGPCGSRRLHASLEQLQVRLDRVLVDASSSARTLQPGGGSAKVTDSSATVSRVGGEVALAPLGGRSYEPSGTPLPAARAMSPLAPPSVGSRRLAHANGLAVITSAANAQ